MGLLVPWIKHHIKGYASYQLAREAKWCVKNYLKESKSKDRAVVTLKPDPDSTSRGNVLLSYIIDPFLLEKGQSVPVSHTNYWESQEIARAFLELGYSVDVIHFTNRTFVPEKKYSIFIDARFNLQRLAPLLNKECVKIMHIDLCHMLFNNAAEANRLLALQQRKGVTLSPRRFEWPNLGIEHADCAVVIGNEFTINTFKYANKPMYRVPVVGLFPYPSPEGKDLESYRRHYLWFGSGGLVRKGLDLVLDTLVGMPDYHLTVIGPVKHEADFERAYWKELYETQNIRTVGWVDLAGSGFLEIANKCLGLIYPSCSEGQAGSVINCLHAGLIPIVSYESGVDIENFGVLLKDCSIEEIKSSIRMISSLSAAELKKRAVKAWEYARMHHTRERYAEEYRKIIAEIIDTLPQ